MAKVRRSRELTAPADYSAALDSADTFYALGTYFLPRVTPEIPEGTFRGAPPGLGEMVGSATNLSFALELYIKALLIRLRLPVPHRHNLRTLYGGLPGRTRREIERRYDAFLRTVPKHIPAAISIAKGPATAPGWGDYSRVGHDLTSVLRRSHDTFDSWRYIFEYKPPPGVKYQSHQFEYLLLTLACQAIKGHIEEIKETTREET